MVNVLRALWSRRESEMAERVRLLESQLHVATFRVAELAERVTHLEDHAITKQFRRGQL